MEKLKVKYVPLSELEAYPNNARKHTEADVAAIRKSIEAFGFNDPIGIWHGVIVEGHGRLLAAQELGMKEVPVIELDHLTDDQRRAYALAHNKTAELSGWDFNILDAELANLADIDMTEFGFEAPEEKTEGKKLGSLDEKFIIPPFSILYSTRGKWLAQKRKWIDFGIKSELGREGGLIYEPHINFGRNYK